MGDGKAWWNHWITGTVAILTAVTFICGGFTFLYHEFITKENHKFSMEQTVSQFKVFEEKTVKQFKTLEQATVKQFKAVSIQSRRRDLKDSYEKLLNQKYELKKKLAGCGTLDHETKLSLEKDIELADQRLWTIAKELRDLRAKIED